MLLKKKRIPESGSMKYRNKNSCQGDSKISKFWKHKISVPSKHTSKEFQITAQFLKHFKCLLYYNVMARLLFIFRLNHKLPILEKCPKRSNAKLYPQKAIDSGTTAAILPLQAGQCKPHPQIASRLAKITPDLKREVAPLKPHPISLFILRDQDNSTQKRGSLSIVVTVHDAYCQLQNYQAFKKTVIVLTMVLRQVLIVLAGSVQYQR